MAIITLTTDWGSDGMYIGAFKGKLNTYMPGVSVVDVTHEIKPFDLSHAAFVMRNTYKHFPEGSVHILAVGGNINPSLKREFIVMQNEGHYFIGMNDGVWGVVFNSIPEEAHYIDIPSEMLENNSAFPELELFSAVATGIIQGVPMKDFGSPFTNMKRLNPHLPILNKNEIKGHIIYFDVYGNAITNIAKEDFEDIRRSRSFEIFVSSNAYVIDKINKHYQESRKGQLLSIYSFSGLLELAVCNGNAKNLLNLDLFSEVIVKFYDNTNSKNENQGTLFG